MAANKMGKKKKWLLVTGIVLLLLVGGTGAYAYSIYKSVEKTMDAMNQPIKRINEKRTNKIVLTKKHPFSVLVLGVDERLDDQGRSDSIMVLTVNPNQASTKILSIPRDTKTEIIGKGFQDKINHSFAFGGVNMSVHTIENFLDIPIDYYVKINMDGFKDIVDAVGGVTVNNDIDFTQGDFHFTKGELTLNGEKALAYSRMRYDDPRGDFGRQQRQRQIILAILNKGANINTLTNYNQILEVIGKNITTNLTLDEIINIQANYKEAVQNIEQIQISGYGEMINNIYYQIIPDNEKTQVQKQLKDHLEL